MNIMSNYRDNRYN